jgi:hypothetical protein
VAFVLLNPKDYTDHVMLNMTKETYEPCTRREELLRGLVGVYFEVQRHRFLSQEMIPLDGCSPI